MGDDEVAMEHRVALRSAGVEVTASGGRPLIGIATASSELNPCDLPLRERISAVRSGIRDAGGLAVEFSTVVLGEDLMKPTAMLYRNLLAIEVEETVRAYPLDGLVLLGGCDKTLPGLLMGAISAAVPALVVPSGGRPACYFRGEVLGSGTDLWRFWDKYRAGELDGTAWSELEQQLAQGRGTCNTMGTASTMAILSEVLGYCLPGTSTIPSNDGRRAVSAAYQTGRRAAEKAKEGVAAAELCSEVSIRNAIRVLNAIGGSTNAVIHLAAIAGRLGIGFDLASVDRLGRDIPMIVDVKPSGQRLIHDFDAAGGVPALLRVMADSLEDTVLADGRTVSQVAQTAPMPGAAILSPDEPLVVGGAFRVVHGSLAPGGALLKRSAASPHLLRHRGRAVVFKDYEEMRRRVEDPDLPVDPTSVLVLAGCGPVGGLGMPEWGMIPIPRKLLEAGVTDMVRVTDARMSGTSYGTVYLHVAPEAAAGGPLALVRDGDWVEVDADHGRLDLLVEDREVKRRREAWQPPPSEHLRGWPALYRAHVTQAPAGCDFDFLQSPTPAHRVFIEPVVGRS